MAPLLLDTGAAALSWRRIRQTPLAGAPVAKKLRALYRSLGLQAALHELSVARVIAKLSSAGVKPLLGKGWAIARLYPEPGLRPCGDIDLCVPPERYATAEAALRDVGGLMGTVDLHPGTGRHWAGAAFTFLDDRSLSELYARSQLVRAGDTEVRILGPEDHLRLLCLHLWGHGAWRPLWLCDIGAALEVLPAEFDWNLCLAGDARRSEWVVCVLGLAHRLLDARLDHTPIGERAERLPHWLVPTVLRQWGTQHRHRTPISLALRRPSRLLKELVRHWPNGIEATADVHGPCNEWPRLPFQLAACVARAARFVTQ